jgi:hypothetical protein
MGRKCRGTIQAAPQMLNARLRQLECAGISITRIKSVIQACYE